MTSSLYTTLFTYEWTTKYRSGNILPLFMVIARKVPSFLEFCNVLLGKFPLFLWLKTIDYWFIWCSIWLNKMEWESTNWLIVYRLVLIFLTPASIDSTFFSNLSIISFIDIIPDLKHFHVSQVAPTIHFNHFYSSNFFIHSLYNMPCYNSSLFDSLDLDFIGHWPWNTPAIQVLKFFFKIIIGFFSIGTNYLNFLSITQQ